MYCTLYWPKVFRSIMDIVSLLSSCVVGEVVVYLCCYLWLQCHCQRKTDGISGALFSGQPALLFRYTLHSLYRQALDLEICFCHWQTWDSLKVCIVLVLVSMAHPVKLGFCFWSLNVNFVRSKVETSGCDDGASPSNQPAPGFWFWITVKILL